MTRKRPTTWNVTFVGDYATVTTTVEALDENDAETLAANLIMDYYDFDVADMANDVVAEQIDEVPASRRGRNRARHRLRNHLLARHLPGVSLASSVVTMRA